MNSQKRKIHYQVHETSYILIRQCPMWVNHIDTWGGLSWDLNRRIVINKAEV